MNEKRNKLAISVLFIAPVFLIYTVFLFVPLIQSSYYSLTKWNGVSGRTYIGFENYKDLAANGDYWITFLNTMKLTVISLIVQICFGLLLAYLLYSGTRGMKIFRTVLFLPVVIAPAAIGLMFSLFYNSQIGIFNKILSGAGLAMLQTNWLSNPKTLLYAVMAPQVWQYIGLYVTIFLGALQTIPEELLESAQIDGAGKTRTFFSLILPQLSGFMNICVILCITGSLKAFDHSWVMTGGGPGVRSAYLGVLMYKTAFVNSDFGMGSAITISIVVISLFITVLFNKLAAADKGEM